jgi:hypothetical protein
LCGCSGGFRHWLNNDRFYLPSRYDLETNNVYTIWTVLCRNAANNISHRVNSNVRHKEKSWRGNEYSQSHGRHQQSTFN